MKKKILTLCTLLLLAFVMYQPIKADAAWELRSNKWYYRDDVNGKTMKNRWVGNYYVGSNGAMVTNRKIGAYFVGEDGKWIPSFKGGWQYIGKKWYYYTTSGIKKTGWVSVGGKKYYCNGSGVMMTGLGTVGNKSYYFKNPSGYMENGWKKINGKWYYFLPGKGYAATGKYKVGSKYYYSNSKGIMQEGWVTTGGSKYYLTPGNGVMVTGWKLLNNKWYYFASSGPMSKGLKSIGNATYYFDSSGVMQISTTITVGGVNYKIDKNGYCTAIPKDPSVTVSKAMIFFTLYESGGEGYNQTGGDRGNACGKYQFDNRYSLLPLVQYCYSKDPVIFKEFKTYAAYAFTERTKLKSNTKFFTAWKTIYRRAPKVFAAYQDAFAVQEYYKPAENYLRNDYSINIGNRPDIVKGAVFSYAIQHGSYTAALAVKNAGINNNTSNTDFIKKLYKYRMSKFSYHSRYTAEMKDALSYL